MVRKKASLRIPLTVTVTMIAFGAIGAAGGCKKECPVYDTGGLGGGPSNPDGGQAGNGGFGAGSSGIGAGGGSSQDDCSEVA